MAGLHSSHAVSFSMFPGNTKHGFQAVLNVEIGSSPGAYADSHGRLTLPDGPTTPASPFCLDFRDNAIRGFAVSKLDQHLVEDHVIQHSISGIEEAFSKAPGMTARSFNEVADTLSAQRAQCRP